MTNIENFNEERFDRVLARLNTYQRHALGSPDFSFSISDRDTLIIVCDGFGRASACCWLMHQELLNAIVGLFESVGIGYLDAQGNIKYQEICDKTFS